LATVDELWLDVFQRLCDATAHQLKGALNGVAINLEVLRSRSGRTDMGAGEPSLAPFAESAVTELESVIESAEAMLALGRSPRGPTDVSKVVRDVRALLARPAKAQGHRVTVDKSVESIGMTTASASAARLAVGATLLAAVETWGDVVCAADAGVPTLRVSRVEPDGSRLALDEGIISAARGAAVHLDITETGATITFPT
jgi:hypothetical protein